jgi:hypothetical protein
MACPAWAGWKDVTMARPYPKEFRDDVIRVARDRENGVTIEHVYLFWVAQMLEDYAVHGAVLRRYSRSVSKLTAAGVETVARFQEHLRLAGCSASTVRTYGTLAGEFVARTRAG